MVLELAAPEPTSSCGFGRRHVLTAVCCVLVQITNGLGDALLRASAERAVQAVMMAPLTLQDEAADDQLTDKVLTGEPHLRVLYPTSLQHAFSQMRAGESGSCADTLVLVAYVSL
jgi:hypothetical protein